jgi:hypothetical protein
MQGYLETMNFPRSFQLLQSLNFSPHLLHHHFLVPFSSPPLSIYPTDSPILLLSKYKWLPPPFKMLHHLLPLLVLNPNRNMKFSSVLEVETPVILLPTIYVMLWTKKGLSPLRTIKILRWEIPFRRHSWMQSKNRGRQSSFCLKIMHLPHGAWKNLLRLLNA